MEPQRRILIILAAAFVVVALAARAAISIAATRSEGRIVVLMVWDGLRPDLVDQRDTPNLFALAREGSSFKHHHSIFPTLTMVNAAGLATGGFPDDAGIFGDSMYLEPALGSDPVSSIPLLGDRIEQPLQLEDSHDLALLNGSGGFNGYLIGVEGVAQQVARAGGYVAIIGKQGPTFMFDDQVDRRSATLNYLFVADDMARPDLSNSERAHKPPMRPGDLNSIADRDRWFTNIAVTKALPAARAASLRGRPALIVLWQHNPDLVEHLAGLGTQPALNALRRCDANLASIRGAIAKLGLAHRTDEMIVSDHGFATIRMAVSLRDLLVGAGLKRSATSDDVIVARNGGEDLVYLSESEFASDEARRAMLARIVDFAEAQEWCGPIFSRKPAPSSEVNRQNHLGWIPGTFAQEVLRLDNTQRSPDLIISFRELPDSDNRGLTGPENPAFALEAHGQVAKKNVSYRLVRSIPGAVYSDARSFSTGLGMHGAAGTRELHNVCVAAGPDFRRHFVDAEPSGNADVAATIRKILNQGTPTGAAGRVLHEALAESVTSRPAVTEKNLTSYLVLQGQEVITTLQLTQFDGQQYLDGSSVSRKALGGSP